MHVQGNKPVEGRGARRFAAPRPAPKEGAKSFADALKNAKTSPEPPRGSDPAAPAPVRDSLRPSPDRTAAAGPAAEAAPDGKDAASGTQAKTASPGGTPAGGAEGPKVRPPTSFADHMEQVRYRLQSGYYSSKAIEDALSDKLSGYFDDLA